MIVGWKEFGGLVCHVLQESSLYWQIITFLIVLKSKISKSAWSSWYFILIEVCSIVEAPLSVLGNHGAYIWIFNWVRVVVIRCDSECHIKVHLV